MTKPYVWSHGSEASSSQPVDNFLKDTVRGLFAEHADFLLRGAAKAGDRIIRPIFHLTAPPTERRKSSTVDYDYVYQADDIIERVKEWGIFMTAPSVSPIVDGTQTPGATTHRQYVASEDRMGILRRDLHGNRELSRLRIQGTLETPSHTIGEIRRRAIEPAVMEFLGDVLRLQSSSPVRPETLILPNSIKQPIKHL